MTQKTFDVLVQKDVEDLFQLFAPEVKRIDKGYYSEKVIHLSDKKGFTLGSTFGLSINWHDQAKILRPVDESKWIGCIGWFWDRDNGRPKRLGVLTEINLKWGDPYHCDGGMYWKHFRPAKRDEVPFAEDLE